MRILKKKKKKNKKKQITLTKPTKATACPEKREGGGGCLLAKIGTLNERFNGIISRPVGYFVYSLSLISQRDLFN
jgi:hypothetical protein